MHFRGYSVEILVNDQPLTEYTEDADTPRSTPVTQSHVKLDGAKIESPIIHFACIPTSSSSFTVRINSPQYPVIASIYLDGLGDDTVTLLNGYSRAIRGLYSSGRDQLFLFQFAPTLWEDRVAGAADLTVGNYGSRPGSIVVAFWESYRVNYPTTPVLPTALAGDEGIERVRLKEGKGTKDLEIGVGFKAEKNNNPLHKDWCKKTKEPLAVLVLEYRSAFVLASRGHDVDLGLERGVEEEAEETEEDERFYDRKIKRALTEEQQEETGESSRAAGLRRKGKRVKREREDTVKYESSSGDPILIGSSDEEEEKKPVIIELE